MTEMNERLLAQANSALWRFTSDITAVKNAQGVYVAASQAFARVVGYEDSCEVLGKTDLQLFTDPELLRRYADDDSRLREQGLPLENYVEPLPAADGKPRYGLTSKYPLRAEDGSLAGIILVVQDVTREYQAREIYENELRNLFDLPPDAPAAVLFDITAWRVVDARFREGADKVVSRYQRVDEYFQNVAPLVVGDVQTQTFFSSLNRESLEKMYYDGKRGISLEYRRRMPDGSIHWVRDELHFLLDPVNGNLSLIIILRDIEARRREYAQLLKAVERDSMTGLLNHEATVSQISAYLSEADGTQALFMIDLDNFKLFNDRFGHQYGDAILIKAAESLRSVFRASDIVGRLGGDEFMVLMKDVSSEAVLRRKAEALLNSMQFSVCNEAGELTLTTSVGVSIFLSGNRDFETLYAEADAALYQSKNSGKNQYSIYRGVPAASPLSTAAVAESFSPVQLRTLLDYMDGGVVLLEAGAELRVTYLSPSYSRSFARGGEQITAQNFFADVLPEDSQPLRAALFEAADSNDLLEHSYRVSGGGQVEWRRLRVKRIPESGDGIRRLVAVVTDITHLQQVNRQLQEAEERYRLAVEETGVLLWEVDIARHCLILNGPGWNRFHNGGKLKYPEAPESFLASGAIFPESRQDFRRMFDDLYAGVEDGSYYFHCMTLGNRDAWVKSHFRLLRNEKGAPYRALGVSQPAPYLTAELRGEEKEAAVNALAIRHQTLERRYQQQAHILRSSENDELTGLLGQRAFYRYVREFLDKNPHLPVQILRFDLNRFKVYNDVRGLAAGDRLLRDLADFLPDYPGGAILCGHLDADHFVLLTPDDERAVASFRQLLAAWLTDYASDFHLSASVGIYRIEDRGLEISAMCDRALLALRTLKGAFETQTAYFTAALRDSLLEEQELIADIDEALAREEFELFFQPQYDCRENKLIGAEALVRWRHPQRGLLSPAFFLPLFEKNGLIHRLDEYVWEQSCRYIRHWSYRYPQARELSLSVSVNVSRLDLYNTRLCATLRQLTQSYDLPPSSLRLEISEAAYTATPHQLIAVVRELRQAGFVVELDDFGSGFSSLNMLKDVTVDVLKPDVRLLCAGTDSARSAGILRAVVNLSRELELPIIAEGVETQAQVDLLRDLGCVYMQGYYFSQPLPAAEFEQKLADGASVGRAGFRAAP